MHCAILDCFSPLIGRALYGLLEGNYGCGKGKVILQILNNIVSDRQTDKNLTDIANMNNRQTDEIVVTSHGVLVMK